MANIIFLVIVAAALLFYVYFRATPPFVRQSPSPSKTAELVKVLLRLEEKPLDELFRLYREQFGQGAARYARHTYLKWKAGEVRPNKQTFDRLLIHLPKVMSFDLKCEVLRKLREEYCSKDNYELTVYTDDWKEKLNPLVAAVIEKTYTAELPRQIEKRLRWLSENEMQAARAILAESQARESRMALALLQQEISEVENLLAKTRGARKVTHQLKLPCGTITLRIKRRRQL
ncbi:MAG TPA: hypothetical protein VEV81_13610 [Pyrinomonadaceae bacterium]|nr:hypothetical protein [Pyrinomonadaceae bacterium]